MTEETELYGHPDAVAVGPVGGDEVQIGGGQGVELLDLTQAGGQRQQLHSLRPDRRSRCGMCEGLHPRPADFTPAACRHARHRLACRVCLSARARGLIDDLVDLLIETIHHIGARAERKVERELLDDLKRVTGKQNLLFALADATLAQPDGVVRDVVFPVVGEQTLRDLVKEWKATGPTYRTTLRTVIRNSYQGHYRRMVPTLLVALEFRSSNERHRPVMQALELVKRFADTKVRTFPADEEVPLDGVVRGLWHDAMVEKDAAGRDRINRVTYEVAVLEALREQLRCKEIWVVGANRYRNPDEDLPADFGEPRRILQRIESPARCGSFHHPVAGRDAGGAGYPGWWSEEQSLRPHRALRAVAGSR